ncbi:PPE family protein [Mycobacterium xenopi 4042]|uniref:PPE family protein n=1 Tax=Mycobacterium xenopi 4042 TaxID=1299334 RepID=X8CFT3_MYCXE|nr:PPE family protein [Mycobacterium xenopi 4042]
MYAGPGSGSMWAAAAAWDGLSTDLRSAATSFQAVMSGLTGGAWQGPASMSMATAAVPYVGWLTAAATHAESVAEQARVAAAAFETALAATVPPGLVTANRTRLMSLVATNFVGQNTAAIAAAEAEYAEMWAQDVAAMSGYDAKTLAATSQLEPFGEAPPTWPGRPPGPRRPRRRPGLRRVCRHLPNRWTSRHRPRWACHRSTCCRRPRSWRCLR